MGFDLETFAKLRPHVFHTSGPENLHGIRASMRLDSAAHTLRLVGRAGDVGLHRSVRIPIKTRAGVVTLMDQAPLRLANMALVGGWTFADLLQDLNSRVFFWPGTEDGPIRMGMKHFARYRIEGVAPVILRIATSELVALNPQPEFAKYNTGAPRWAGGKASPRGPGLFSPAAAASFSAGDVKEVTFVGSVVLPPTTMFSKDPRGPWRQL